MGRKAKFDETTVPKGPGRKAKKQGEPTFPKGLLVQEEKTLSHRQRQRARKRLLKQQSLKENLKKLKKGKHKQKEDIVNQNNVKNVSKELKKMKGKKSVKSVPFTNNDISNENEKMEFDEDSDVSDAKNIIKSQKKNTNKKLIDSDLEDVSDVENGNEHDFSNAVNEDENMEDEETDQDEDEVEDNNDSGEDNDLLPIEKANKKLKKKQKEEQ